jgi:stearoyl-CoA desaturase (delta-9 desaturase)
MSRRHYATKYDRIRDFAGFPELVWLNRFDKVVPAGLAAALYLCGLFLEHAIPLLRVTGLQLFVWGFVVKHDGPISRHRQYQLVSAPFRQPPLRHRRR